MRSGLLALRAAGLVATIVAVPILGTTAADAHDSVNATVTPSAVRPGGEVKIKVTGCANPRSAAARSNVFVADSELASPRGGDRKSPLNGEAKVKSSTKEGKYKLDVWCDGHDHRGAAVLEVDHNPKPKPSVKPSTKVSAKPSAKASAKASAKPSPKVSAKPSAKSSAKASAKPSTKKSAKPSAKPKANPSIKRSVGPSAKASAKPSTKPSVKASAKPSVKDSAKPSAKPSVKASAKPSTKASSNPRPSAKPKADKVKPEGRATSSDGLRPPVPSESAPASKKPNPAQAGRQSQVPQSSPASRTAQAHQQAHPQAHPRPSDQQASPVAPVSAGGGGRTTIDLAGDEAGPSTPHTVIGLVLAGVAAVAVAIRSARRKRSAARDSE